MHRTPALEALTRIFAANADKNLLILPDNSSVTYREFWERSEKQAQLLAESGCKAGDRLLVQLENSERLLELYLACAIGGFVACPIDPATPKEQIAKLTSMLSPAMTVTQKELEWLQKEPSSRADFGTGEREEDYLVIFSSGSTGQAKGIVHTLASITESAKAFAQLSGLNSASVVYHHFPMFYMAGLFNMFLAPLHVGATIVVGPRFSKSTMLRFWELPQKHGVNSLTLTPTMAASLCQLYRRDNSVLEHVAKYQSIASTSSVLYQSIAERFAATFKVPLRNCYGVSEVGATITMQAWEDALAFQSMGGWSEEVEIRAGSESGPEEILVKTPFMAKGYLIGGVIQKLADPEGFFHTGDLGYIKNGLLFFSGRENDLLKKGGEFVSTQAIEDLALKNVLVTEVAVVGVPDEFWGSRLALFYVPQKDVAESEILAVFDELFSKGLRDIERPDKIVPVPWMPKTSIGKIKKRDLLDKYSVGPQLR